jgi:ACT domain-containing protein
VILTNFSPFSKTKSVILSIILSGANKKIVSKVKKIKIYLNFNKANRARIIENQREKSSKSKKKQKENKKFR